MLLTNIVLSCLVAFKVASSATTAHSCATSASASPSISKATSTSTTTSITSTISQVPTTTSTASTSIPPFALNNTTSSIPTSNSKYSPISSSHIELATIPAETISIAPTIIESAPPATGTVSPAVFNANLAEVEGLNNLFSTLNFSSPCISNEIACISGNVGICGCQGNFVITKVCSTGQQCFALPMKTIRGVFVGCTDRAAAISELGLTSTSTSTSTSPSTSTLISTSISTSPSTPPSSSLAASVPGSGCVTAGATCDTYKLLACPKGICFCGLDVDNRPTCLQLERCENTRTCSANSDCAADEACNIMDCCGRHGRCVLLAEGCLSSPAAKRPSKPLLRLRAESSNSSVSGASLPISCISKASATLEGSLIYTVSSSSSISSLMSEVGSTSIVPGCAYILATDLGAGALCSSDYCNCGGSAAPLLTSSISGTLTTNCDYQTQPTVNSCPPATTTLSSTSTVLGSVSITLPTSTSPPTVTELVVITCTTSRPGSSSCKVVTTSLV